MTLKLTKEQSDALTKLSTWCFENNSDTFSVFFNYMGHCNSVDVSVCVDGWKVNNEKNYSLHIHDGQLTDNLANEKIAELTQLKQESDERNAPENKEALEAKLKAEKIERLKQQLEELEG